MTVKEAGVATTGTGLRRVVPRGVVSLDDFGRFTADRGWSPVERGSGGDPPDATAWTSQLGTWVTFRHDPVLDLSYAELVGEQAAAAEALIHLGFDCFGPREGTAAFRAASSPVERVAALRLLAASAPGDVDPEVAEAVLVAMTDEDPRVRLVAAVAATYGPWPQLAAALSWLAEHDPAGEVRQASTDALTVIDAGR